MVCVEIDTNQYPISADLGYRPHHRLTTTGLRRTPPAECQAKQSNGTSVGPHAKHGAHRTKCLPTWLIDYRALARIVVKPSAGAPLESDPECGVRAFQGPFPEAWRSAVG